MRYWWVNQKQTYRHEVPGGYMWSPKRNRNGASNRAYDSMRTVVPGDMVFSFANGLIKAVGIVCSYCYEFPRPEEFGKVGESWEDVGWRVDVNYRVISNPIRPKDYIEVIRASLPPKYSPLQANGNGNQTFYLLELKKDLALVLARLMDSSTLDLVKGSAVSEVKDQDRTEQNLYVWENAVERSIQEDASMAETMRETLISARRGQGLFRTKLLAIEGACRVTGVNNKEHLIASHTKPWRDSSNDERLDPENGFMLTPSIDHLFDRGFISFENNGDLFVSPVAEKSSLEKMGIPVVNKHNVGSFSNGQKKYLEWHRESILLAGQ